MSSPPRPRPHDVIQAGPVGHAIGDFPNPPVLDDLDGNLDDFRDTKPPMSSLAVVPGSGEIGAATAHLRAAAAIVGRLISSDVAIYDIRWMALDDAEQSIHHALITLGDAFTVARLPHRAGPPIEAVRRRLDGGSLTVA
jgi:hypothetical protein